MFDVNNYIIFNLKLLNSLI